VSAATKRWAALLRGINVGGKNLLPMKELVAMFAAAGASDVESYIQSGNVVFSAGADVAAKIPDVVGKRIEKRFGFAVPIVVRSADELAAVARGNPFLAADADFAILAVMFLADKPSARAIAALDPGRSPPDEFVVRGREIFVRCPNGFARTKLTNAWFDSKLATTSTARNWRTVLKLLEMTRE
jgi:uncharacterized protein (DUF1697 family)